jgi:4-hydroxybenzoate polyprenyltransferase
MIDRGGESEMAELPARDDLTGDESAPAQPGVALAFLRLARPRQWIKNLLLFAALVFAKKLFDAESLLLAVLAFASFCLASSSAYLVNDLLDAEVDRQHPEKRHRPIAAGVVSKGAVAAMATLLTAGGLLLAFWIGPAFAVTVAIYLGTTHFYSLVGKNVAVVESILIAAGFVIRAVAGAVAIGVPSSNWFILCTFFLAMFLALSKRKGEILALEGGAGRSRPVLSQYTLSALTAFSAVSVASLLLSYALYVLDLAEQAGTRFHLLELTFPFVMFGVFRYYLLVETSGLGEKPEEVALQDRPIQICVLGFFLVAVIALYLDS